MPNELLIAARMRVESPGSPGQHMTRQELAEPVNDHVFRATGRTGAEALSIGRAYGSERIISRAREFRASLPVQTIEARQLDDALAALYEREDG